MNRGFPWDNPAVKSILLLAIVGLAGPAAAKKAADSAAKLRCDIAWAYIQGELSESNGQPPVFSTGPFNPFVPDGYPQYWGSVDGQSAASSPPPGLAASLPASSNAVRSCPSIQRSLTRLGIRFGEGATTWAGRVRRGAAYRAAILTVSLPAVSADGEHAVRHNGGGLDTGEGWVHMERGTDGSWRATGITSLWVS